MGEKRLDLKVGFACNNNCRFCVQAHKKGLPNKKTSELKKYVKDSRQRCDTIVFTGGEPTLRKDIFDLVMYASELNYKLIQIQTNGRMFSSLAFCKKMINAGANEFGPALHGYCSKQHDYLTRAPSSFKQTVKGIINLKKLNQKVITNTVITKPNYKNLPEIVKLLVKLKIDQFQFAFVHPVGNAWHNFDSIVPRMSLAAPYIKKGLQIGIDNGVACMVEAVPYCIMQGYEKYASEEFIPETEIVDANNVFIEDYKKIRIKEGKQKFEQCRICKYNSVCEGPWKEYPEKFGNLEFKPICK